MPAADSDRLAQQVAAPTPYAPPGFTPPGPRELRAQAVKRLQIGLFGLATMLLLVALANIIMERARMADSAAGATTALHAAGSSGADPLADLGVIPSPDAGGTRRRGPAGANH